MTSSSLSGEYLLLSIQVSKDFVPVVSDLRKVPDQVLSLGISDVTYDQLVNLHGSKMTEVVHSSNTKQPFVFAPFLKLEEALKRLPVNIDIYLHLIYFGESSDDSSDLLLNETVDCVLRTVNGLRRLEAADLSKRRHRRFVFSSSDPDICAALNWKQPNYPVIFSPCCLQMESQTSIRSAIPDSRCRSIANALSFIKSNNILGVCVPATTLLDVPPLAYAIKETGVLLLSEGTKTQLDSLASCTLGVDGFLLDGTVYFYDATSTGRSGVA